VAGELGNISVVKTIGSVDPGTRERVARLLFARGPQTVAELAGELGLTAAAIRRHLDAMLAAGEVAPRPVRRFGPRGRGRPAQAFALSETGHAAMPNAYDDIASAALRYLAANTGQSGVGGFAAARGAELERRYRPVVSALGPASAAERASALAGALSADGYAAATSPAQAGMQLCQHRCPVRHVAEQFPQLCDAETEAFGRLLGTHVQRLATIAHGDDVCTTHIPTGRTPA
jgi:predicted ArsR family transcriptional regulator